MASSHGTVAHLLPTGYKKMVAAWLEEDCPTFDYGGFVVGESVAEARLLGKSAVSRLYHQGFDYVNAVWWSVQYSKTFLREHIILHFISPIFDLGFAFTFIESVFLT